MSEQQLREELQRELITAMRTEGNLLTVHAIAHSVARVLADDHLRVSDQLRRAGVHIPADARGRPRSAA